MVAAPSAAGAEKAAVPLAGVVAFLDDYLDVAATPDYPGALNGLQVEAPGPVERVAVAVDASTAVIREAAARADLLVVHHGLFWGGAEPLTGHRFERVRLLVENRTALYSVHLPLDAHPEVGNAAVLARRLGMAELAPFGRYEGTPVGCRGRFDAGAARSRRGGEPVEEWRAGSGDGAAGSRSSPPGLAQADLADRLAGLTGASVQVLPGGPAAIEEAAVVTGAGASTLREAAAAGLGALVTGEAQHHHAIEAAECGVSVFLAGHYATETWGVQAVAELLRERFGIETWFVDSPTGM